MKLLCWSGRFSFSFSPSRYCCFSLLRTACPTHKNFIIGKVLIVDIFERVTVYAIKRPCSVHIYILQHFRHKFSHFRMNTYNINNVFELEQIISRSAQKGISVTLVYTLPLPFRTVGRRPHRIFRCSAHQPTNIRSTHLHFSNLLNFRFSYVYLLHLEAHRFPFHFQCAKTGHRYTMFHPDARIKYGFVFMSSFSRRHTHTRTYTRTN